MRTFLLCGAMVLVLAACGDQPLGEAGGLTRDWLGGGTTTSTAPVSTTSSTMPSFALRPSGELVWYTATAEPLAATPEEVVREVWERTNRIDEFVQAGHEEIAAALPGLEFPSLVPADVAHVTSQLVYTTSTGELSDGFQAAFGFWSSQPYTRDRSVAQLAVLWVARDVGTSASIEDPGGGCAQFAERVPDTCRAHQLEEHAAWLITERSGATLIWFADGYRYELFHRSMVARDEALAMADAMVPLASLTG